MDSGATDHMTATLRLLTNVKEVSTHQTIKLPTGDTAVISHIGDVTLSNGLTLNEVLYVPKFNHNLLSIHKLAHDNDCQVVFYPEKCLMLDSISNEAKGMGILKNGLYYMACDSDKECNQITTAQTDSSEYAIWHNRLGHAPMSKIMSISTVKNHISSVPPHICITCPIARFTKLPFNSSLSHAGSNFELIHADIWGPYKVHTRGKYRYFLILVDDCSRMVWVYLLQFKSNFLQSFKAFYAYAGTQFNMCIKVLRKENALEFKDKECTVFYAEKGIMHHNSISYKPQQNGRVERRHRYILEMARALKF